MGTIPRAVFGVVNTPSAILSEKQNNEALVRNDVAAQAREIKADAIDDYFKSKDMPLEGMGMKMVLEAEKNDLDWRLLPAISVRESTGGKYDCDRVKKFEWIRRAREAMIETMKNV